MKKCAVIGSINMDLVVGTPRFPAPGETITGSIFRSVPGGKGANQAVALARLGVETRMAGMVGDDGFGQTYLEHFRKNGVNVEAVETRPGATTGLANILVSDDGENVIVLVPGANALCDGEWLERALAQTAQCDVFLLQLELPLDTVCKCVERLHAAGKTVVLANAKDDQGQPCTKYLKFSFEKGRPLTYSQNPDLAQTVAPSNESRTQLAVNNEGKTNEATKHVKEPLQQGQTAPKDETQQKRQTRKSKGVKVS